MRLPAATLTSLLLVGACAPPVAHPSTDGAAHWGYEGAEGPMHWAALSAGFATCASGRQQSPVDLSDPVAGTHPAYSVAYAPIRPTLRNNGHTIQVDYPEGSTLTIGGESFTLLQYHFHAPSEHTLNGRHFPMELHLVHRGANGLAVLGVMIREGARNEGYAALLDNLPGGSGEQRPLAAEHRAETLLPAQIGGVYRYQGSLTTPPCSEEVSWHVLADPVELSTEQIAQFRRVFAMNSRPVQPLAGRALRLEQSR
jgi:carbonic anhydrase